MKRTLGLDAKLGWFSVGVCWNLMYRYGDGTPFPLEENFIDTLVSAVRSTAAAYVPISQLEQRRQRAEEGKLAAEEELASLAHFEQAVTASIDAYSPSSVQSATAVQQVAHKVLANVQTAVTAQRSQVSAQVARLTADASSEGLGAKVRQALAGFFEKHQLPSTTWVVAWDVRGAIPNAQALATSGRFAATFDLAIAGDWGAPVRIESLLPGGSVQLPRRKMFGGAKTQPVALDKCALVAFERSGGVTTLFVRESAGKPSPGWKFVEDSGSVNCVAIDSNNDVQSDVTPLATDDAVWMTRLGDAVSAAVLDLRSRRNLRELRVGNVSVDTLPAPRLAVDALLTALSPLVRNIRERSKMSGELVLKRDVGDGRREELFVPRVDLARAFTALPEDYRRLYEEMGLSAEQTDVSIVIDQQATLSLDDD